MNLNDLLILTTLERAPMHGYQVALEVEERSGGAFSFAHGTLYPILHRLEQDGLIAGVWTDPSAGRARKQYALTADGRRALAAMIGEWRAQTARVESFLRGGDDDAAVRTGAA